MLGSMHSSPPSGHQGKAIVSGMLLLLLFSSAPSLAATDYFIRPKGEDAAKGDSTNAAWQTIERVNRARFQPGDRLLF